MTESNPSHLPRAHNPSASLVNNFKMSRDNLETTGDESGKKEEKIGVGEKKKKNRRANRLARLARRYFSNLTAFFAFFPHCVAWSQARRDHSDETSSSLW